MAAIGYRITSKGLEETTVGKIVPDFNGCTTAVAIQDMDFLPYPLNGVANAVGENAFILNCHTHSGQTVPVISARFTL
jgi:hypothetical protein